MTLIELIGFIITMIVFFLLIGKQARDQRRRREHPEEFEQELEEQQTQIKEILQSLNLQADIEGVEESRAAPTPPPIPEPEYPTADDNRLYIEEERRLAEERMIIPSTPYAKKKGSLFVDVYAEKERDRESIHEHAFEQLKLQQSRVKKSLGEVDTLKHAVILREILGPPKGLQYKNERF